MINYILNRLLDNEGEHSDDPDDAGGETIYGITKRDYPEDFKRVFDAYKRNKASARALAKNFYLREFWDDNYKFLTGRMGEKIFDLSVLFGKRKVIMLLQEALNTDFGEGLKIDGIFGKKTLAATNKHYPAYPSFIYRCVKHFESIVKRRPQNQKFFLGWLNRLFS